MVSKNPDIGIKPTNFSSTGFSTPSTATKKSSNVLGLFERDPNVDYGFSPFDKFWDTLFAGGAGYRSAVSDAEQTEYNRWLQEEQWKREDTANQRAVSDMRSAGLSPLSQFGGASSSDSSVGAGSSSTQSPVNVLGSLMSVMSSINSVRAQNAQIEKTNAESKKILSDVDFDEQTKKDRVLLQRLTRLHSSEELNTKLYDTNYMRVFGITPGMTKEERLMQIIKHTIGVDTHQGFDYVADGELWQDHDVNKNPDQYKPDGLDLKTMLTKIVSSITGDDDSDIFKNPLFKAIISILSWE